ncbi:MAG: helix-turn-helix domain-containing protein [Mycobacteriales bacterium]
MSPKRNGLQSGSSTPKLPVLGQATPERADAARNRVAILAAAERLFREHGVSAVSMDLIAAEAGVGKGTLFRRFGDKAGLAVALLDERERELQAAVLSGKAPLGPGAPASERLRAFASAYARFAITHVDLLHVSETASPGARYRVGSYRLWHRHVANLLAESGNPVDADYLAHALLAALAADVVKALLEQMSARQIVTGATRLARLYAGGG